MTPEIILVFVILAGTVVLFVTEIIRIDLTALIVLVVLVFTGLVRPDQALSGFSNQAVVAVWAMFILSAGLTRTGVSSMLGERLLRYAKKGDGRLVAVLVSVTALLSSIMNNTAVAAMFLPVMLEISRRTKRPASRLLMPMAFGSLLGGLILLIGTASNLVIRDVMREAGYEPLRMFDFAPGGLVILAISVIYMALVGWRLLPVRQTPQPLSAADGEAMLAGRKQYELEERLATLILPENSSLAGKSVIESRIGRALGLNILSIQRKDGQRIPAEPHTILEGGDRLLVLGRLERIDEICQRPTFTVEEGASALQLLLTGNVGLAEFQVLSESLFAGKSLIDLDFRQRYEVNVLAVRQGDVIRRTNLQELPLQPGDDVLIQGPLELLDVFRDQHHYRRLSLEEAQKYHLDERLLSLRIAPDSSLAGRTLMETRLGAAYGLAVLRIARPGQEWHMPKPDMILMPGDLLVVGGRPLDIEVLKGLQALRIERYAQVDLETLASGPLQFVEVMLSPYTNLAGKTLRELHLREKYGISVLAIWRGQRAYRSGLGDIALQPGDALLCYGEHNRFKTLAGERDFVVLKMDVQTPPRLNKAPFAVTIMAAVIIAAIITNLPISVLAIAGCVLMVLSGALTMDEAYQSISWRAIFLIAAMLPLGIALQQTGAATLLGDLIVRGLGQYGPTAILLGLMLLCMAATQVMPSPVAAVIITPIALTASQSLGVSPYAYLMGVAYALAAAFLSPAAVPANIMIMSPGGYRYSDYLKNGVWISLIVLLVSILLLPVLFPY